MVIACAVVKYQALSAGGARDMVSAGKSGTLRRPRISRRGHDIGGDARRRGVLIMARRAWDTRLVEAILYKGEVLWAGSMAKSH